MTSAEQHIEQSSNLVSICPTGHKVLQMGNQCVDVHTQVEVIVTEDMLCFALVWVSK